jgi:hypothetical protein
MENIDEVRDEKGLLAYLATIWMVKLPNGEIVFFQGEIADMPKTLEVVVQ